MVHEIVGILVAGGQSRRFGSPKAFLKRDGKLFYQYSVDALLTITDSIVIVTNSVLEELFLEEEERFPIITDKIDYKGLGPLSGIYTGMDYKKGEWFAVAPVDVPFIDNTIFRILDSYREAHVDAVVPIVSGKIQPLISIYHCRVKQVIRDQLEKNELSLQSMLNKIRVKYVTINNLKSFYNINQREDYEKWIRP